jgi:hypothetical protein
MFLYSMLKNVFIWPNILWASVDTRLGLNSQIVGTMKLLGLTPNAKYPVRDPSQKIRYCSYTNSFPHICQEFFLKP